MNPPTATTPVHGRGCAGMTLRRAIDGASAKLAAAGVASARVDAELLAAHVAGVPRGRLAFAEPPADFGERYGRVISARAERVPLQHLTGTAAFGPLTLQVGPGVFVPRPETEALLEWAAAVPLPAQAVIVDVCTGAGGLALALQRRHPRARVVGVDDCAAALRYARANAEGTAVEFVHADVMTPAPLDDLDGRADLVVANPPYIPDGAELAPEVADHDPAHALFGGPDGMVVIRAVAGHAARWLRPGGLFAVEHDDTTSAATVDAVVATGAFARHSVTAHRDLTGRWRFVTARRSDDDRGAR